MSPRAELALLRPGTYSAPGGSDPGWAGVDELEHGAGWRERAVCKEQAPGWDLDRGTLGDWRRARAACRSCPVRAACRAELLRVYPRAGETNDLNATPVLVTWAGVSFGPNGRVMDDQALRAWWTRIAPTAAAGGGGSGEAA